MNKFISSKQKQKQEGKEENIVNYDNNQKGQDQSQLEYEYKSIQWQVVAAGDSGQQQSLQVKLAGMFKPEQQQKESEQNKDNQKEVIEKVAKNENILDCADDDNNCFSELKHLLLEAKGCDAHVTFVFENYANINLQSKSISKLLRFITDNKLDCHLSFRFVGKSKIATQKEQPQRNEQESKQQLAFCNQLLTDVYLANQREKNSKSAVPAVTPNLMRKLGHSSASKKKKSKVRPNKLKLLGFLSSLKKGEKKDEKNEGKKNEKKIIEDSKGSVANNFNKEIGDLVLETQFVHQQEQEQQLERDIEINRDQNLENNISENDLGENTSRKTLNEFIKRNKAMCSAMLQELDDIQLLKRVETIWDQFLGAYADLLALPDGKIPEITHLTDDVLLRVIKHNKLFDRGIVTFNLPLGFGIKPVAGNKLQNKDPKNILFYDERLRRVEYRKSPITPLTIKLPDDQKESTGTVGQFYLFGPVVGDGKLENKKQDFGIEKKEKKNENIEIKEVEKITLENYQKFCQINKQDFDNVFNGEISSVKTNELLLKDKKDVDSSQVYQSSNPMQLTPQACLYIKEVLGSGLTIGIEKQSFSYSEQNKKELNKIISRIKSFINLMKLADHNIDQKKLISFLIDFELYSPHDIKNLGEILIQHGTKGVFDFFKVLEECKSDENQEKQEKISGHMFFIKVYEKFKLFLQYPNWAQFITPAGQALPSKLSPLSFGQIDYWNGLVEQYLAATAKEKTDLDIVDLFGRFEYLLQEVELINKERAKYGLSPITIKGKPPAGAYSKAGMDRLLYLIKHTNKHHLEDFMNLPYWAINLEPQGMICAMRDFGSKVVIAEMRIGLWCKREKVSDEIGSYSYKDNYRLSYLPTDNELIRSREVGYQNVEGREAMVVVPSCATFFAQWYRYMSLQANIPPNQLPAFNKQIVTYFQNTLSDFALNFINDEGKDNVEAELPDEAEPLRRSLLVMLAWVVVNGRSSSNSVNVMEEFKQLLLSTTSIICRTKDREQIMQMIKNTIQKGEKENATDDTDNIFSAFYMCNDYHLSLGDKNNFLDWSKKELLKKVAINKILEKKKKSVVLLPIYGENGKLCGTLFIDCRKEGEKIVSCVVPKMKKQHVKKIISNGYMDLSNFRITEQESSRMKGGAKAISALKHSGSNVIKKEADLGKCFEHVVSFILSDKKQRPQPATAVGGDVDKYMDMICEQITKVNVQPTLSEVAAVIKLMEAEKGQFNQVGNTLRNIFTCVNYYGEGAYRAVLNFAANSDNAAATERFSWNVQNLIYEKGNSKEVGEILLLLASLIKPDAAEDESKLEKTMSRIKKYLKRGMESGNSEQQAIKQLLQELRKINPPVNGKFVTTEEVMSLLSNLLPESSKKSNKKTVKKKKVVESNLSEQEEIELRKETRKNIGKTFKADDVDADVVDSSFASYIVKVTEIFARKIADKIENIEGLQENIDKVSKEKQSDSVLSQVSEAVNTDKTIIEYKKRLEELKEKLIKNKHELRSQSIGDNKKQGEEFFELLDAIISLKQIEIVLSGFNPPSVEKLSKDISSAIDRVINRSNLGNTLTQIPGSIPRVFVFDLCNKLFDVALHKTDPTDGIVSEDSVKHVVAKEVTTGLFAPKTFFDDDIESKININEKLAPNHEALQKFLLKELGVDDKNKKSITTKEELERYKKVLKKIKDTNAFIGALSFIKNEKSELHLNALLSLLQGEQSGCYFNIEDNGTPSIRLQDLSSILFSLYAHPDLDYIKHLTTIFTKVNATTKKEDLIEAIVAVLAVLKNVQHVSDREFGLLLELGCKGFSVVSLKMMRQALFNDKSESFTKERADGLFLNLLQCLSRVESKDVTAAKTALDKISHLLTTVNAAEPDKTYLVTALMDYFIEPTDKKNEQQKWQRSAIASLEDVAKIVDFVIPVNEENKKNKSKSAATPSEKDLVAILKILNGSCWQNENNTGAEIKVDDQIKLIKRLYKKQAPKTSKKSKQAIDEKKQQGNYIIQRLAILCGRIPSPTYDQLNKAIDNYSSAEVFDVDKYITEYEKDPFGKRKIIDQSMKNEFQDDEVASFVNRMKAIFAAEKNESKKEEKEGVQGEIKEEVKEKEIKEKERQKSDEEQNDKPLDEPQEESKQEQNNEKITYEEKDEFKENKKKQEVELEEELQEQQGEDFYDSDRDFQLNENEDAQDDNSDTSEDVQIEKEVEKIIGLGEDFSKDLIASLDSIVKEEYENVANFSNAEIIEYLKENSEIARTGKNKKEKLEAHAKVTAANAEAIYRSTGQYPKKHQMLISLCYSLLCDPDFAPLKNDEHRKRILAQVNTSEGKTMIGWLTCFDQYYVYQQHVDLITANIDLARRDCELLRRIANFFGIKVELITASNEGDFYKSPRVIHVSTMDQLSLWQQKNISVGKKMPPPEKMFCMSDETHQYMLDKPTTPFKLSKSTSFVGDDNPLRVIYELVNEFIEREEFLNTSDLGNSNIDIAKLRHYIEVKNSTEYEKNFSALTDARLSQLLDSACLAKILVTATLEQKKKFFVVGTETRKIDGIEKNVLVPLILEGDEPQSSSCIWPLDLTQLVSVRLNRAYVEDLRSDQEKNLTFFCANENIGVSTEYVDSFFGKKNYGTIIATSATPGGQKDLDELSLRSKFKTLIQFPPSREPTIEKLPSILTKNQQECIDTIKRTIKEQAQENPVLLVCDDAIATKNVYDQLRQTDLQQSEYKIQVMNADGITTWDEKGTGVIFYRRPTITAKTLEEFYKRAAGAKCISIVSRDKGLGINIKPDKDHELFVIKNDVFSKRLDYQIDRRTGRYREDEKKLSEGVKTTTPPGKVISILNQESLGGKYGLSQEKINELKDNSEVNEEEGSEVKKGGVEKVIKFLQKKIEKEARFRRVVELTNIKVLKQYEKLLGHWSKNVARAIKKQEHKLNKLNRLAKEHEEFDGDEDKKKRSEKKKKYEEAIKQLKSINAYILLQRSKFIEQTSGLSNKVLQRVVQKRGENGANASYVRRDKHGAFDTSVALEVMDEFKRKSKKIYRKLCNDVETHPSYVLYSGVIKKPANKGALEKIDKIDFLTPFFARKKNDEQESNQQEKNTKQEDTIEKEKKIEQVVRNQEMVQQQIISNEPIENTENIRNRESDNKENLVEEKNEVKENEVKSEVNKDEKEQKQDENLENNENDQQLSSLTNLTNLTKTFTTILNDWFKIKDNTNRSIKNAEVAGFFTKNYQENKQQEQSGDYLLAAINHLNDFVKSEKKVTFLQALFGGRTAKRKKLFSVTQGVTFALEDMFIKYLDKNNKKIGEISGDSGNEASSKRSNPKDICNGVVEFITLTLDNTTSEYNLNLGKKDRQLVQELSKEIKKFSTKKKANNVDINNDDSNEPIVKLTSIADLNILIKVIDSYKRYSQEKYKDNNARLHKFLFNLESFINAVMLQESSALKNKGGNEVGVDNSEVENKKPIVKQQEEPKKKNEKEEQEIDEGKNNENENIDEQDNKKVAPELEKKFKMVVFEFRLFLEQTKKELNNHNFIYKLFYGTEIARKTKAIDHFISTYCDAKKIQSFLMKQENKNKTLTQLFGSFIKQDEEYKNKDKDDRMLSLASHHGFEFIKFCSHLNLSYGMTIQLNQVKNEQNSFSSKLGDIAETLKGKGNKKTTEKSQQKAKALDKCFSIYQKLVATGKEDGHTKDFSPQVFSLRERVSKNPAIKEEPSLSSFVYNNNQTVNDVKKEADEILDKTSHP